MRSGTVAVAPEVPGRCSPLALPWLRLSRARARRWFLQRWDAQLRARDAGDAGAVRRLRRLHWGGMLTNAILLFAVVGSIPYVAATQA